MRRLLFLLLSAFFPLLLTAQNPDGDYNPYVNNAAISPTPLLPVQVNGTGTLSFIVGNNGSDPLDVFANQYITLTITLSYGAPGNANPLLAIGGTSAGLFSWSYNSGTYTAVQSSPIPSGSSGTITISYAVIKNSAIPGANGFNVNISPAPYHTSSNSQNDDAVSSYTWTELRDYGDAAISYGSADHILDFTNYLGTLWDGELAYQASPNAKGDDNNGVDDEDGVVFPAEIRLGETANISVTVTGIGYLNAWIDWNGDGDFLDAGERVAINIGVSNETANLAVAVPAIAIISIPTFARFRLSSTILSSPTGSATGGEVEDYMISISCNPPVARLTSSDLDNIFCAGSSITYTAGGGTNYDFRTGGTSLQSGASATYTTSSVTNGQSVYVIVSDGNGCIDTSTVISITVNSIPPAPAIVVINNCDGTSSLSTTATGTLSWSTGQTTPGITVTAAGLYTVTTTVNGCISPSGSGTAAPRTAPAQPVVSNASPGNVCPFTTINLITLVTSTTPTGGTVLYKTTNNPAGTDIPNPAAVGAGTWYIFYMNQLGCYSNGTAVNVSITPCPPDLTPTLIVSPNIMHGVTDFDLIVRVTELNLTNTSGLITIRIPRDPRWILTNGFVPSLTLLGSTPLNNSAWTYSSDAINHIFTSSAVIPAGGFSTFGFKGTFDPGNSRGIYTITSQLVSGGGGEVNVSNNVDSEKIDYFQE